MYWHSGSMTAWHGVTSSAREFMAAATADPGQVLLALDFDGTLAAIVPDPEDSRLNEDSARALGRLNGRLGQVAIITGRAVETLARLARLEERPELAGLVVLGGYGAQRWLVGQPLDALTLRPASIAAAGPLVDEAVAASGFAGVVVEDKVQALGVHTRRSDAPDAAFDALVPVLSRIADELGLTLEPGRRVLELRASSMTKGDALRDLIVRSGASIVTMCGDDLGDVAAFEALDDLRAEGLVTCRVVSSSPEQTGLDDRADILAEGPDGIADWLEELAELIDPAV